MRGKGRRMMGVVGRRTRTISVRCVERSLKRRGSWRFIGRPSMRRNDSGEFGCVIYVRVII